MHSWRWGTALVLSVEIEGQRAKLVGHHARVYHASVMNEPKSPGTPGFELQFVDWLRERSKLSAPADLPGGAIGIGDDMAMLNTPDGRWLMSSDMLLDGVHFDSASQSLAQIGRKAIACSLSDCAAMAVCPVAVTVSLALPNNGTLDQAKELMGGMQAMADEFETHIVGGDTTRWGHPLAIDVAIVARPYDGVEPVLRSGAKAGDTLYVTGQLGGSRLAEESCLPRHLAFTPRVREARSLAEHYGTRLHAMLDISDGLSLDLWRLCRASGVGATLTLSDLESAVSEAARRASSLDGESPIDHALNDGEDFELLIAMSGEVADAPVALHRIGRVTEGDVVQRESNGDSFIPIEPRGYVH